MSVYLHLKHVALAGYKRRIARIVRDTARMLSEDAHRTVLGAVELHYGHVGSPIATYFPSFA